MKLLLTGFLLMASLSALAQKNVTGRNINTNTFGKDIGMPGNLGLTIYAENLCKTQVIEEGNDLEPKHNMRTTVVVRLDNINVSVGSSYVGVTSEGDIANVYNDGSGPVMAMQICHRKGVENTAGKLLGNPVLNNSLICQVDEITIATVNMPTTTGSLFLNFRPIHFSESSLCNETYLFEEQSDSDRGDTKEVKEDNSNNDSVNVSKQ